MSRGLYLSHGLHRARIRPLQGIQGMPHPDVLSRRSQHRAQSGWDLATFSGPPARPWMRLFLQQSPAYWPPVQRLPLLLEAPESVPR